MDQSKSLMDELESYISNKNKHLVIESRADNIISSAVNLLESIHESFSPEEAEELTRRLINSIKNKDPSKFRRKIREIGKSEGKNNEV